MKSISRRQSILVTLLLVLAVIGFYTPHYEVFGELPQSLAFELGL